MKVTVFGATGGVGGEVVRQALDRGHEVTAVVRDGSGLRVQDTRLQVAVVPDLQRPALLVPLIQGRDAVVSAVGPRGRRAGPVAAPVTAGITAAMLAADVRRLVAVSAVPVGPVPPGESALNRRLLLPVLKALLAQVYEDLGAMERGLAASSLDWTVVRPPRLVDAPLSGRYRVAVGSNVPRSSSIARADVAHLMLQLLGVPASFRQPVGVSR